jgi:hypothetical protein
VEDIRTPKESLNGLQLKTVKVSKPLTKDTQVLQVFARPEELKPLATRGQLMYLLKLSLKTSLGLPNRKFNPRVNL